MTGVQTCALPISLTVKVLFACGIALDALSGMEEGWSQSLQKLADLVAP